MKLIFKISVWIFTICMILFLGSIYNFMVDIIKSYISYNELSNDVFVISGILIIISLFTVYFSVDYKDEEPN